MIKLHITQFQDNRHIVTKIMKGDDIILKYNHITKTINFLKLRDLNLYGERMTIIITTVEDDKLIRAVKQAILRSVTSDTIEYDII